MQLHINFPLGMPIWSSSALPAGIGSIIYLPEIPLKY